jgi:DNA-binding FrmR family transcriptional regulator
MVSRKILAVKPAEAGKFHEEREKLKLLQRIRKLRGQLDAVERSLSDKDECGDQLMLLAAVRGGVNSLMGEVLERHVRFHLTDGSKEKIAPELAEDLIDLVRAYLK